jgi:hypothetical protein
VAIVNIHIPPTDYTKKKKVWEFYLKQFRVYKK